MRSPAALYQPSDQRSRVDCEIHTAADFKTRDSTCLSSSAAASAAATGADGSTDGVIVHDQPAMKQHPPLASASVTTVTKCFFKAFDPLAIVNAKLNHWQHDPTSSYHQLIQYLRVVQGMQQDHEIQHELVRFWQQYAHQRAIRGQQVHQLLESELQQELSCVPMQQGQRLDQLFPVELSQFRAWRASHATWKPFQIEWGIEDSSASCFTLKGRIDSIWIDEETKAMALVDWKVTKDLTNVHGDHSHSLPALAPFQDLEDCRLSEYTVQQNLYKFILEHNYGIKIHQMLLVQLEESLDGFREWNLRDLQDRIPTALETYRDRSLQRANAKQNKKKEEAMRSKATFVRPIGRIEHAPEHAFGDESAVDEEMATKLSALSIETMDQKGREQVAMVTAQAQRGCGLHSRDPETVSTTEDEQLIDQPQERERQESVDEDQMKRKRSLATLHPHPRDKRIEFHAQDHHYEVDGVRYDTSVTQVSSSFFDEFDAHQVLDKWFDRWSTQQASSYYQLIQYLRVVQGRHEDDDLKEEIAKFWQLNAQQRAHFGTEVHRMIELDLNQQDTELPEELPVEFEMYHQWKARNPMLVPYRTEWSVFDEEFGVAGQVDAVFMDAETGEAVLVDWKTCAEMKETSFRNQTGAKPFEHLPDSNYYHYMVQVNLYKWILARNYGVQIDQMRLVQLNRRQGTFKEWQVDDLQELIPEALEAYRREFPLGP